MYAHPSFLKDQPQALVQLRKIDNRRRCSRATPPVQNVVVMPTIAPTTTIHDPSTITRAVSPPTSAPNFASSITIMGWQQQQQQQQQQTPSQVSPCQRRGSNESSDDRGKLDLLAFALEQEFAKQQQTTTTA